MARLPKNEDAPEMVRLPGRPTDSARIQDDLGGFDEANADRRRTDRAEVDAKASLGGEAETGLEAQLHNLSVDGCSLELSNDPFDVGDKVWFSIDTIQPWRGTVRWVDNGRVGVEFDRPFYPAVFELLVQLNKPVTCSRAA